jgi:glycosyltransferase involved in cell wall biosynthesis
MPFKLGVLATHPVQYHAPYFRALAAHPEVDLTVFYCMLPNPQQQGVGFGVDFAWDIPLLDGYRHALLRNVARRPGLSRFLGCDTPEIAAAIRDGGFDAFLITGWNTKSHLQALRACRRMRVPALVRGESNSLRRRPWLVRRLHRSLLRRFAAALFIGEANRRFYVNNGVPATRLFFTPYAVDNARFAARANELLPRRAELRRQWSIPTDAFVPLFCGKLIHKKRPLDLIAAAGLTQGSQTSIGLHPLLVGDGPLRRDAEAAVAARRVPATFAGFLNQSRIVEAYVAADCLVLPSDAGETWGLVVNEAMACGRPAIVSDMVGCNLDLVAPGKTGYTFPLGGVESLASHLTRLAREPAIAPTLGASAKALVERRYSIPEAVAGTGLALRSLGTGFVAPKRAVAC